MDNKEFVKTFCPNDLIQAFLNEQGFMWVGTDMADNAYDVDGNCQYVWLVTERSEFPIPARLDISPLTFTIVKGTYNCNTNELYYKGFLEFGATWREFMTKHNEHYLLVAAESLDEIKDRLSQCYVDRDNMYESLSDIKWMWGKRFVEAESDREWCKISSELKSVTQHINEALDRKKMEIKQLEESIVEIGGDLALLAHERDDEPEKEM